MSSFQLLLLLASAFFAFKVFEHIQTLQDPSEIDEDEGVDEQKTIKSFSPFSADELVQKADDAYASQDFTKALAFLSEANEKDQNNDEILFKIGYIFQKSGDIDEAIKYYHQALDIDANNEYVHNSLASIYREKQEYESAQKHLLESLKIDPENAITNFNYANLLIDMGDEKEAQEFYKNAMQLDPEFSQAKQEYEKLVSQS